jgi:hypothetical protein
MPTTSLKDGVFEPEETTLMGQVFEAACEEMCFPKCKWTRELIALRILEVARKGELDPVRLRANALVGISDSRVLRGS